MKYLYSYLVVLLLSGLFSGNSAYAHNKSFITEILPTYSGKLFENQQISVNNPYPYPANDYLTFTYQIIDTRLDAKIVLYDVVGNQIAGYRLQNEYTKLIIPTSSLRSGVYFYSLVLNDKVTITKKIVVNH